MRIIVVGAGRTGRRVASHLAANYDVVIVEKDPDVASEIEYSIDALVIRGDGTSPEVLEEAGVGEADYLIATTTSDQTNIVICSLAKGLGGPFTVAMVRNMDYLTVWGRGKEALGVDRMACSTPLIARSIADTVEFPGIRVVRNLYGPLHVAEAVQRPKKMWSVEVNGRIIAMGTLDEISREFGPSKPRKVLIMGASTTSILTAGMLEGRHHSVKLIEMNEDAARDASERLEHTTVIRGDATDPGLWEREALDDSDMAVVSLGRDEDTLFGAMFALDRGLKRVIAVVHDGRHVEMFERAGVVAVSPEVVTAEKIILSTQKRNVVGVVSAIPGVRIVALQAGRELAGKRPGELPFTAGPVVRGGSIVVPGDDFVFREDDVVTLVLPEEKAGELVV